MTRNLVILPQKFKSFTNQKPNPVALMMENTRLQNEIRSLKEELVGLYRERYQSTVNNLMVSFRQGGEL